MIHALKHGALFASVVVAMGCAQAGRSSEAGVVRIDGSAGVMPLVTALAREYRTQHPGVSVQLGPGLGSRQRLDSLTAGRIDIALASIAVAPDELARRGFVSHEIARVAVVFAANAGVRVERLTQRQVCDAFAGRVTNWSQLGGADIPIATRTRPAGEVDGDVAVAGVPCLKEAVAAGLPKSLEKPEEMAADLASVAGAFGMTSMPFVEQSGGRIRALELDGVPATSASVRNGTYPLIRSAMLLTRGAIPPATARFLEFVRGADGARIIAANGGVPVQ